MALEASPDKYELSNTQRPDYVRLLRQLWAGLAGPLLAILGGLGIGALFMLVTGHNPLEAYAAMLEGAFGGRNFSNLVSTVNRTAPIVGMGLAAALAFRAGLFNIGGEGQLVLGGVAAALTAIYAPVPDFLRLPLALIAAAAAGGAYAWLAALFQFRFNVPLLVATLLMNYPARFAAAYLVAHPFRDIPSGLNQTVPVPEAARFADIGATQLHTGIFVTLTMVLAAAFIIRQTVPGYEIRMSGLNTNFVRYGGVDVQRQGYRVMFISGAVAGLVGAIEVLGAIHRFTDGALTLPLYAWTGIMAALLAGSAPLGVLLAGFFFSAVQTGGAGMERTTEVARELSRVLQAVIIMLIAVSAAFRFQVGGGLLSGSPPPDEDERSG